MGFVKASEHDYEILFRLDNFREDYRTIRRRFKYVALFSPFFTSASAPGSPKQSPPVQRKKRKRDQKRDIDSSYSGINPTTRLIFHTLQQALLVTDISWKVDSHDNRKYHYSITRSIIRIYIDTRHFLSLLPRSPRVRRSYRVRIHSHSDAPTILFSISPK